jgi:putative methionine-R-sulfoxide reductase with GAF domain
VVSGFQVPLASISSAFRGAVPAAIATCSADGIPNVTYLSIVLYLDEERVALSNQFMSKTLVNLHENPRAAIRVIDPATMDEYDLDVRHVRSEASGELFDSMRAQLEALAAQVGTSDTFRLRRVEILKVEECRHAGGEPISALPAPPGSSSLDGLEIFIRRLAECRDLAEATRVALESIEDAFGFKHSVLLVADGDDERLFVVASNGYPVPGVGAEVPIGEGAIGVAAHRRKQVRISNMTRGRTLAAAATQQGATEPREIPLPGLADAQSVLATPLLLHDRLVGVLYLDSDRPASFDESAAQLLEIMAGHLAVTVAFLEAGGLDPIGSTQLPQRGNRSAVTRSVAFYDHDGTVLVDGDYVIKGVPGRILFSLLTEYATSGRTEFTNKEIRLNRSIGLPAGNDNLEARLLSLRRRLAERDDPFHLERVGRGRLVLTVDAPFKLHRHDTDVD